VGTGGTEGASDALATTRLPEKQVVTKRREKRGCGFTVVENVCRRV
jgi:hypothetical protein